MEILEPREVAPNDRQRLGEKRNEEKELTQFLLVPLTDI